MRGVFRATSAYAYLQALAQGDGGGRETGLGFGLARGPAGLDPEAIGAEGAERAVSMVEAMDREGFGYCSNHAECEAVCPKEISIDFIARMNRDYLKAKGKGVMKTPLSGGG